MCAENDFTAGLFSLICVTEQGWKVKTDTTKCVCEHVETVHSVGHIRFIHSPARLRLFPTLQCNCSITCPRMHIPYLKGVHLSFLFSLQPWQHLLTYSNRQVFMYELWIQCLFLFLPNWIEVYILVGVRASLIKSQKLSRQLFCHFMPVVCGLPCCHEVFLGWFSTAWSQTNGVGKFSEVASQSDGLYPQSICA